MKWLFLILLLLNFAASGWMWLEKSPGNASARNELNPEKIRIASDLPPSLICYEWGAFSGEEISNAQDWLSKIPLKNKISEKTLAEASSFWTYIPPAKSKAEAEKKIRELNEMGIRDHSLVQSTGKWNYAISLGVFKTLDAARKQLALLQDKGVKSAVAGEKDGRKVSFLIQNADPDAAAQIENLPKQFPSSSLSKTGCPAD